MVDQVNRLVEDRLLAGEAIALPGVGSLYIERRGARRISRQMLEPPCRRIVFTSQIRGVSLVEVIVSVAQCDEETALKVYQRWLEAVQREDGLHIEDVGTLSSKHFTPDPTFDEVLNPQGHEPVRIENDRHFDWVLWLGVVAIVGVLGFVAYWWYNEREPSLDLKFFENHITQHEGSISPLHETDPMAEEEASDVEGVEESVEAADAVVTEPATAEDVTETVNKALEADRNQIEAIQSALSRAALAPEGTPDAPATLVPGRSYVVIGVFSEPENAAKRIREIEKLNPSLQCSVYRFGDKLMLSPYESATVADCRAFMRLQRGLFPDLWPYTAR